MVAKPKQVNLLRHVKYVNLLIQTIYDSLYRACIKENETEMNMNDKNRFDLDSESLYLNANAVPWDSDIFGFPVAAISAIKVKIPAAAQDQYDLFNAWVSQHGFKIVSCRLPHQQVETSIFLERNNFRFIEMVLHPMLIDLQAYPHIDSDLNVEPVGEEELPGVISMAERAFGYERYHVDPRLDSRLANIRYGHWVKNSFYDSKQVLLKITLDGQTVGFFVIENIDDGSVYWHLTAVNPDLQGKRLGYRIWMAMLGYHKRAGMKSVRTTISARNTPVLNLYSKLNFRFEPPEMTFHWVKSGP
jgi:RimJ/RimL family protein N-acetyltransferase